MQKPVLKDAHPYIRFNKFIKQQDENKILYTCVIIDEHLKLLLTVVFNNIFDTFNQVELEGNVIDIVKYDMLYLSGLDEQAKTITPDYISCNPEISNTLFSKYLDPYGIKINKMVMRSYDDFESNDFIFTDEDKKK